jgi:hypothetical protein
LKLDLVLNNKSLALVLNWLGELGRDGVVSSRVLDNEALVAIDALEHMWLLNSPLADVCPLLIHIGSLHVLLRVGWLPSLLPVVCELLDEVALNLGRLLYSS